MESSGLYRCKFVYQQMRVFGITVWLKLPTVIQACVYGPKLSIIRDCEKQPPKNHLVDTVCHHQFISIWFMLIQKKTSLSFFSLVIRTSKRKNSKPWAIKQALNIPNLNALSKTNKSAWLTVPSRKVKAWWKKRKRNMKIGYPLALQTYYLGRINRFFVRLSLIFFAKKKIEKKRQLVVKNSPSKGILPNIK